MVVTLIIGNNYEIKLLLILEVPAQSLFTIYFHNDSNIFSNLYPQTVQFNFLL